MNHNEKIRRRVGGRRPDANWYLRQRLLVDTDHQLSSTDSGEACNYIIQSGRAGKEQNCASCALSSEFLKSLKTELFRVISAGMPHLDYMLTLPEIPTSMEIGNQTSVPTNVGEYGELDLQPGRSDAH
jgi:hypothetical protein